MDYSYVIKQLVVSREDQQPFTVCNVYWQSIFSRQNCQIYMHGDVTGDIYLMEK